MWLSGKEGKNSVSDFPCLDCLARASGRNATQCGLNCHAFMSRRERSADLEGLVSARSMAVFQVRTMNYSHPEILNTGEQRPHSIWRCILVDKDGLEISLLLPSSPGCVFQHHIHPRFHAQRIWLIYTH